MKDKFIEHLHVYFSTMRDRNIDELVSYFKGMESKIKDLKKHIKKGSYEITDAKGKAIARGLEIEGNKNVVIAVEYKTDEICIFNLDGKNYLLIDVICPDLNYILKSFSDEFIKNKEIKIPYKGKIVAVAHTIVPNSIYLACNLKTKDFFIYSKIGGKFYVGGLIEIIYGLQGMAQMSNIALQIAKQ